MVSLRAYPTQSFHEGRNLHHRSTKEKRIDARQGRQIEGSIHHVALFVLGDGHLGRRWVDDRAHVDVLYHDFILDGSQPRKALMHELGLLHGVVSAVEEAASNHGARSVERVGLRVGARSGAHRVALEGSWPLATIGTICQEAHLEIEEVPARVWCSRCADNLDIDEFFALACPVCGGPAGHIVSGSEFEVAYADME
jgi:hydrogenase nickel incorporation protein HypA/HybF